MSKLIPVAYCPDCKRIVIKSDHDLLCNPLSSNGRISDSESEDGSSNLSEGTNECAECAKGIRGRIRVKPGGEIKCFYCDTPK